jgi:hypothetical protein
MRLQFLVRGLSLQSLMIRQLSSTVSGGGRDRRDRGEKKRERERRERRVEREKMREGEKGREEGRRK